MRAVPDWSGVFYQMHGGGTGIMSVHVSDTRHHKPPSGWSLFRHLGPDPADDDIETYIYKRTE